MLKCFVYKVKNMYILVNQIVQESLYFWLINELLQLKGEKRFDSCF